MNQDQPQPKKGFLGLNRVVVVLGFVSLLTDLSSEMMIPIQPLFMRDILKIKYGVIGIIEGFAEFTASILRVYSGWLADRLGRPKLLATSGYAISSISKPFMALATAWPHAFLVRFGDRFGKGIRSAPRDVIIAESTPSEIRGRAFGFHRAMDTTGAVLGPLAAYLIITFMGGKGARTPYVHVFLLAAIPALLAVIVLGLLVPEKPKEARPIAPPKVQWGLLSPQLKIFLLVFAVFSIGNSSDAFLIFRSKDLGVPIGHVLLIYILFNAISAVFATPAGILSDKIGRRPIVIVGMIIFALTYLGFGLARTTGTVWALWVAYGLFVGLTGGVLRAFAADLAPREIRGTVLGAYYTIEGLCLLPASGIAGVLYAVNHALPFYYGAGTAALAAIMLYFLFLRHGSAPIHA